MTWEQLIGKIREGLGEGNAHLRTVENLLAIVSGDGSSPNEVQVEAILTILTLAVSNIHSAVEHLAIGLDAVVETLRKADKSQEVKSE